MPLTNNYTFKGPSRPPTPPPKKLPDDAGPAWLDTTDEDTDDDDDEEEYLGPLANIDNNMNTLPENIVPYPMVELERSAMYPQGVRDGGTDNLPIHPRSDFISFEDCNELERARLVNLIQQQNNVAVLNCNTRRQLNRDYLAYRRNLFQKFESAHEKYHVTDNYCKIQIKKNRKLKKNEKQSRRLIRRQYRARRDQAYYTLRLQAVVNGMAYRASHPSHSFVVFIRETDVVLQRTYLPNPIYIPKTTTPLPHRELRNVNLETNSLFHLNQTNTTETVNVTECLLMFQDCYFDDENWKNLTATIYPVYYAHSIFELLGFQDTENKIIVVPKNPADEKIVEMKNGLRNVFDIFQATIRGWHDTVQYSELYTDSEFQMKNLEKIIVDSVQNKTKIMSVITHVKTIIMGKMDNSLEWYNNRKQSQSHVHNVLKWGVTDLL